jgi:hypothetical protein
MPARFAYPAALGDPVAAALDVIPAVSANAQPPETAGAGLNVGAL